MKAYVVILKVNGSYYPRMSTREPPNGIVGESEVIFTIEKDGEPSSVLNQAIEAAKLEAERRGIDVRLL